MDKWHTTKPVILPHHRDYLDKTPPRSRPPDNIKTSRTVVVVVVLFPLQLTVVVFSQPGSGLWPPRFRGFVITHNDAPQSVGLLWTSDQSVAETSTWQHTKLTTDNTSMPTVGFEPTISAGERPKTARSLGRAFTNSRIAKSNSNT